MASALDDEIAALRERAAQLTTQLQVHTSTLLAAEPTRQTIDEAAAAAQKQALLALCDAHYAHRQQSLYRAGASITAFRVRDPDPRAVDGGRVLGLRFDVVLGAQFLRPYYVLLHRDAGGRGRRRADDQEGAAPPLRVHRHTVPPSVPLGGLATRHLAGPVPDLYAFARALRHALVRYHNRLAVVGDLRRSVQQQQQQQQQNRQAQPSDDNVLVDVSGADAEAKQIRLDWADGSTGRLVVDDDGGIQTAVVVGAAGARDRAAARALLAGETTALGLVRRLSGT